MGFSVIYIYMYIHFHLGTIHKRRLLRGVGRWGPPEGDLRRRGVDTLILVKETSPF